jgi:sorbitol-6-phosphate 2-dehydrogenase
MCQNERLSGQVAIVTGAAQGIGKALAERLDREGCRLVLGDVNLDALQKTAAGLKDAAAVKVDVTNEDEVNALVETAVQKHGKLDIMVANAGILIANPVESFPAADWKRVTDVNLYGYFLSAKAAAKAMIPQKRGCIIQINSKSGKKGSYRNSAYAASKFGGIGLTQSLALELAQYNIRVNAICPGNLMDSPLWVDSLNYQYAKMQNLTTEELRAKYAAQVPLGRTCAFDDVANVMVFLASEEASYMTGQALNVAGGQEMN